MRRKILVVDDEALVREYLLSVLTEVGLACEAYADAVTALRFVLANAGEVALIVSDLSMPGMNGIEFLSKVRSFAPAMPFILLSGVYDQPIATNAYRSGATDYLLKPVSDEDLTAMAAKYFDSPEIWNEASARRHVAEFLASQSHHDPHGANGLRTLFNSLGRRRRETLQHSYRVAAFSRILGEQYGVSGRPLDQLELGALLHDIGKVAVPRNVIEKPGPLNDEEWRIMRLHPGIGASLLSGHADYLRQREIVLYHHERFDGAGYPDGLRADEIPIGARIFAVADALDAICSRRPYRAASTLAAARREIDAMRAAQFDPDVVDCFRSVSDAQIRSIQRRYAEPASMAGAALFSRDRTLPLLSGALRCAV